MTDILERLTDYIAQCPSANGRTFHETHEEVLIVHSADEIVKLRAALREIRGIASQYSVKSGPACAMRNVARRALEMRP